MTGEPEPLLAAPKGDLLAVGRRMGLREALARVGQSSQHLDIGWSRPSWATHPRRRDAGPSPTLRGRPLRE